MESIEAGPQESNGRGGKRAGAGRKPTRDKYAEAVDKAEASIADDLDYFVDNLKAIAGGRNPGSKTTWQAAGTVIVERVLFYKDMDGRETDQPLKDRNGKPLVGKVPAFPHLAPDELVCVKREAISDGMDAKANMYLLDRIGGKAAPNSNDPPEIDNDRLDAALAALEALAARPDVPNDVKEILAQQSKAIGESICGED